MLQSRGSQKVRHNLVTEEKPKPFGMDQNAHRQFEWDQILRTTWHEPGRTCSGKRECQG